MVAQAELQASAVGLQARIVQRLLQLRRVLAKHRQRFRLFDRQVRGDLAVLVDLDANVDPAKIGRIEPDFKAALAALHVGGDFHRDSAQGYRPVGRRRRGQVAREVRDEVELICGEMRRSPGSWIGTSAATA